MHTQLPLTRDLVLIGGGHTHALVLRKWGMDPLPGVRLTVINPGPTAPYSGMLPGHIAGHYTREALEIDLVRLARFAGARVILDRAVGIDPVNRKIELGGRAPIAYDIASIDIGITAQMDRLPGFVAHATGAKPLDIYSDRWRGFLEEVRAGRAMPRVAVIGGGVAGVELSMAMAHALRGAGATPEVTVIEGKDGIAGVPPSTSRRLMRAMADQGVQMRTGVRVQEVTSAGVILSDGAVHPADLVIGAAGAYPHGWLAQTGLPLTDGFIEVAPDLTVKGVPGLFAVGDCAHMAAHPRPKAGVFAVRAAPILFDNLRAALSGKPLRPFVPQRDYLKLISLGGQSALAEKFGFTLSGRWLWRVKNRIDTKFMASLDELPKMPNPALPAQMADGVAEVLAGKPLCGGCGAKVGGDVLRDALASLPMPARPDILSGPGDDAAILSVGGKTQVISTDHLRAFCEDPALMARITAVHALGDIWAMGAAPQSALVNVILPRMAPPLQARTMAEILGAVSDVLGEAGTSIVGGHSTMGAEMTIGLTVTGLCDEAPITLAGARPGDALILTRPIGSGTILAAEMAGAANGRHVAAALSEMARPQGKEAALLQPKAHAMTDVTGFGLAGHLMAICAASGVGASVDLSAVPLFEGALELAEAVQHSSLLQANIAAAPVVGPDTALARLLHDPQTSGGLLAAVPADQAQGLLQALRAGGARAAIIGETVQGTPAITLR